MPEGRKSIKFGVFYEHQLPRPWTANSEYELFQNSLTQVELADRLGYDYIWEVEGWKRDLLAGRIALDGLETDRYDLYAHQNEDIVRLMPEQIKQRMAEKE